MMKKNLKAVLFAAMFATAGLVAQSAQAALPTFSLESDGSGGESGSFAHTFGANQAGQTFDDLFQFDVTVPFNGSTSVTSSFNINALSGKISDLTITGFNLLRIDPVTSAVLSTVTGTNNTAGGAHAEDAWAITAKNLLAGTYAIEVLGKINGTSPVTYSGDVSILAASPVPETETYGMMLGGLGLLGVVARRKAAKKAA